MTSKPLEYKLLDGRIISAGELDVLTAGDWRFLFWLSLETQRDRPFEPLFDMLTERAPPRHRKGGGGVVRRRIALDMVERATRGVTPIGEVRHDGFVTVREAAALRGVSRQAINHLIRDGKLDFVRRGGLALIDRRSLERHKGNPRKRLSGRQILIFPRAMTERLAPGGGVLCNLERPVLEHVMMTREFSFCVLRPGSRLSDRDLETLERLGIERKGGEAYRDWLEAGDRVRPNEAPRAPPLPRILRHAAVWRFRIPPRFADKPVLGELLRCGEGGVRSLAVLHYVSVDDWGYLDVSFDAPAAAVNALRANAAARQVSSEPTAALLADRPAGSIWCDALSRRFAASLRRTIQGVDQPPRGPSEQWLHGTAFRSLHGIAEANYPDSLGLSKDQFWIDRRALAALADIRPGGQQMALFKDSAADGRRRVRGSDFEKSLSEFHGLSRLAERLGWTPETLLGQLPRIVDERCWSRYAEPSEDRAAASGDPRPGVGL